MINIAVLIPVFNNINGLVNSIYSIDVHDGLNIEVVIVDDGSSIKVDVDFLRKCSDKKITLLNLEFNSGIVKALNVGLKYIYDNKFDYIVRLDAGDLCINNRILKQVNFLENNLDFSIVGSHAQYVNLEGEKLFIQKMPLDDNSIKSRMHLNNCFSHPAVTFRVKSNVGLVFYEEKYKFAEDYKFFWDMIKNSKSENLDDVLIITEANPNGISRTRRWEQLKLRLLIQLKYFNPKCFNSYIGMVKTFILMLTPNFIIENLKKVILKK